MNEWHWVESHWMQIGICWFAVQSFLKAIQDTLDVMPKNLPPLAKVVFIMNSVGSYLFLGNRPQQKEISNGTIS